eukprot:UN31233
MITGLYGAYWFDCAFEYKHSYKHPILTISKNDYSLEKMINETDYIVFGGYIRIPKTQPKDMSYYKYARDRAFKNYTENTDIIDIKMPSNGNVKMMSDVDYYCSVDDVYDIGQEYIQSYQYIIASQKPLCIGDGGNSGTFSYVLNLNQDYIQTF